MRTKEELERLTQSGKQLLQVAVELCAGSINDLRRDLRVEHVAQMLATMELTQEVANLNATLAEPEVTYSLKPVLGLDFAVPHPGDEPDDPHR